MYSLELEALISKNEPGLGKGSQENADTNATDAPDVSYMSQTIPEVRDCNWEQFKNRFPEDKGIYAIETLLGSRHLDEEIEIELLKRVTPEKRPEVLSARKASSARGPKQVVDLGSQQLERIRINSTFILAILSKATGEKWAEKPHNFLRPFKTLIHYHSKMEAEYLKLRDSLGMRKEEGRTMEICEDTDQQKHQDGDGIGIVATATERHPTSTPSVGQAPSETPITGNSGSLATDVKKVAMLTEGSSHKAFEDMTCYIEFMRTQLMPIYTMFDQVDSSKPTKVRYQDLWSLFRIGELVILRPTDKSDSRTNFQRETRPSENRSPADADQTVNSEPIVGRVHWVVDDEPEWEFDDLSETGSGGRQHRGENPHSSAPDGPLGISTMIGFHYIDYDGEEYRGVHQNFNIPCFSGEKDITSLPIFPLRFVKDHEKVLQDLRTRGQKFLEIVNQPNHSNLAYQGWTLTRDPLDQPILVQKGESGTLSPGAPAYIDSDIIVDFREAFASHPWLRPNFSKFRRENYIACTTEDRFSIIRWGEKNRQTIIRRDREVVVYMDSIESYKCDLFLDTLEGRFLLDPGSYTPRQIAAGNTLAEDDLAILPSRVLAYALRERKIINANVRYIKRNPSLDASNAFDKLRISMRHKVLIQSMVFEHFKKKEAQKLGMAKGLEISDQDFIRGKGRGLVILLHGAPGVGKTATAEAVSYAYKKPLFPITCGNLGVEPAEVEDKLTELFRLANLWDCILLLDEAEIFLSPRSKSDDNLQRNALVSGMFIVESSFSRFSI